MTDMRAQTRHSPSSRTLMIQSLPSKFQRHLHSHEALAVHARFEPFVAAPAMSDLKGQWHPAWQKR
ncbi:hypothetical protein [Rhizobium sp. PAMB 3182]